MKALSDILEVTKLPGVLQRGQQLGSTMTDGVSITHRQDLRSISTDQVNTRLKAFLESLESCSTKHEETPIYHTDFGFMGMREKITINSVNSDDLKNLRRELEILNQPSGRDCALREIGALSLVMPRKNRDDGDLKILVTVYASDIEEYPEDVLAWVCRDIRRKQRFFPTIDELRSACEQRCALRRDLLRQVVNQNYQAIADHKTKNHVSWKDLAKPKWKQEHWDDYANEALAMAEMAKKGTVSDLEFWIKETARRRNEMVLAGFMPKEMQE